MQSNLAEVYDDEFTEDEEIDEGPWAFTDAPEGVKKAILEENRYFNVEDCDWYDYTETDFKEQMSERGIDIDNMYFSGFSSQGDGACFEGSIADINKFLDSYFPDSFKRIRKLLEMGWSFSASTSHTGSYYHSGSVSLNFNAEDWEDCNQWDDDDLRYHAFNVMMEGVDDEITDLENDIETVLRKHMDALYKTLENEYDYLTSDEALTEYFEGSDYMFDEDGRIV